MKRSLFVLTTILFSSFFSYAQEGSDIIRSPQIADMMRFDKVGGVSKLSGRLDLNIEVARIKDKDFDMPVTLCYNSAGFMPAKPESYVGLNWSLNAGGAIVREVKGAPDDLIMHYYADGLNSSDAYAYGFLHFVKNPGIYPKDIDIKYIAGNCRFPMFLENIYLEEHKDLQLDPNYEKRSEDYIIPTEFGDELIYEDFIDGSSDIYRFNFGPHSGKFLINFDGSVSVVSNNGGKYKVDLSEYNYVDYKLGPIVYDVVLNSTIKIITDDGYTYYFGGSFDNVEYSISWDNTAGVNSKIEHMASDPKEHLPSISSYHLYKIEAPNGRELNIEYDDTMTTGGDRMHDLFCFYDYLNDDIKGTDTTLSKYRQNFIGSWSPTPKFGTGATIDISAPTIIHTLTKLAIVKRIYTDSKEIVFEYRDSEYGPLDGMSDYNFAEGQFEKDAGAELKKVFVYSKENTSSDRTLISTTDFSYKPWSNNYGSRKLLKSIDFSISGKYEFGYNDSESLPAPVTHNIDFWNYWRGHSMPEHEVNLMPQCSIDNSGELCYGNIINGVHYEDRFTTRSPGAYGMDIGMLNRVDFPTGGSMEVEYESNEYASYVKRKSEFKFRPVLHPNEVRRKAGGLRVKKITRGDQTTSYLYQKSISDNTSSGILINQPIFGIDDNTFYFEIKKFNSVGFNSQSYEEDHIRYSTIIEVPNSLYSNAEVLLQGGIGTYTQPRVKDLGVLTVDNPREQLWTLRTNHGYDGLSAILIIGNRTFTENFTDKTPEELGFSQGNYNVRLETTPTSDGALSGAINFKAVSNKINYSGQTPNGYTIERYTDWHDMLDDSEIFEDFGPTDSYISNMLMHTKDMSYVRGKLRLKEVYDKKNNLIREDQFVYDFIRGPYSPPENFETTYYYNFFEFGTNISNDVDNYQLYALYTPYLIEWALDTPMGVFTRNRYLMAQIIQKVPVELGYLPCIEKISTEYFYNSDGTLRDKIVKTESYQYNDDFSYLQAKETVNSDGSTLHEDYTYSYEKDPNVEPYKTMIEKNMLNTVVQHDVKKNEVPLYSKKSNYVLKELPLAPNGQSGGGIIAPMLYSQEETVDGVTETRTRILQYDGYGNSVHVESDSNNIFYLWSYKGQYPIAEVRGCNDYNTFKSAVEASFGMSIDEVPYLYDVTEGSLTALQNHASMANFHVTTARYKPLVGVTEIADPSGRKLYYEYDAANRLSIVYRKNKDGGREIVNNYQYKLINE